MNRIHRHRSTAAACLALLLACAAGRAEAQDRAELDKTQVIGHRELPKVLYIVPWKKPQPAVLSGRPVHSVLDEALAPVDPAVFRRQVDYGTQLQARAAVPKNEGRPAPAAPGPNTPPNTAPTPVSAGASR